MGRLLWEKYLLTKTYKTIKKISSKTIYFIERKLNEIYPDPSPPLYYSSNFELLIAVLLSAQCTDKVVNRVTPELFNLANTPLKMSKVNLATLKSIIKPCGLYPKKAVAIKSLSNIILNEHKGTVPQDIDALKQLPGVGHKTASVVMVQAFNQPAFPVDTHIHRLAMRWGISNGISVKKTEEDFKKFFPPKSWGKLHLQLIYYGREYCPARGHEIKNCPICSFVNKK